MTNAQTVTPESLRSEAEAHEHVARDCRREALTRSAEIRAKQFENEPVSAEDRWQVAVRYSEALYEQNAAILCRLKALEVERGAGP